MGLAYLAFGETEAQYQDCLSQGYVASEWQGWEANPYGFIIHSLNNSDGTPAVC